MGCMLEYMHVLSRERKYQWIAVIYMVITSDYYYFVHCWANCTDWTIRFLSPFVCWWHADIWSLQSISYTWPTAASVGMHWWGAQLDAVQRTSAEYQQVGAALVCHCSSAASAPSTAVRDLGNYSDACIACMQHGLVTRKLSARLSVRLSNAWIVVNCDKTEERSVQISIPYERTFSIAFSEEKWLVGTTPSTWNFGSSWPRWSEIAYFQSIFARRASAR